MFGDEKSKGKRYLSNDADKIMRFFNANYNAKEYDSIAELRRILKESLIGQDVIIAELCRLLEDDGKIDDYIDKLILEHIEELDIIDDDFRPILRKRISSLIETAIMMLPTRDDFRNTFHLDIGEDGIWHHDE